MENFIEAVGRALEDKNWYAALITALALPDIAGWVESPNEPSGRRYAKWFGRFVQPKYTHGIGPHRDEHVFLSGNDCYALRCAILHEGRDVITEQIARDALEGFQFVAPPPNGCVHMNQSDNQLQLQVDQFCADIVDGVREWTSKLPKDDTAVQNRLKEAACIQTEHGEIRI